MLSHKQGTNKPTRLSIKPLNRQKELEKAKGDISYYVLFINKTFRAVLKGHGLGKWKAPAMRNKISLHVHRAFHPKGSIIASQAEQILHSNYTQSSIEKQPTLG